MRVARDRYATVSRIIRMIEMIPTQPRRVTAEEIDRRLREDWQFEFDRRTLERDLVALATPFLYAYDDEKPRGYFYPAGARPTFLSAALNPHAALTMQLVEAYLKPLLPPVTLSAIEPLVESGRLVLEGGQGGRLRRWPRKIAVIDNERPRFVPVKIDANVHEAVCEALLGERQLRVSYRRRGETEVRSFRLSPWGLVQGTRVTYIIGPKDDHENPAHFALHRIIQAELLDEPARIPASFDLSAYVHEKHFDYSESTGMIRLRLLFPEEVPVAVVESPFSEDQEIHRRKEGGDLLTATVADSIQLRWWLLGHGAGVEVLAPKKLRREIAEEAKAMAARYERGGE